MSTTSTVQLASPVAVFAAAIENATIPSARDAFADDVMLDATVPGWRFQAHGVRDVLGNLAHWFADEGSFESMTRTPTPTGEVLEFTLRWTEHGVPHACHQAHLLEIANGRIVRDTAFCGGRWPAALLAEMEEAAQ